MLPSLFLLSVLLTPWAQLPAPGMAQPLVRVEGKGVQIYTCSSGNTWAFTAPEATLYQSGKKVGSHGAGPRWTWNDGSAVLGKLVTSTPSDEPSRNIPWLELTATPQPGKMGFLTSITRISRTETQGGVATLESCDAGHLGEIRRVPYRAVYTFWVR